MKTMTRLAALLLSFCLLLGMTACGAKPVETVPPTQPPTEAPTEPPAADIYAAALGAAEETSSLMMNILSVKTVSVAGQTFTQSGDQTIYYSGFGTDAMKYRSTESIIYGDDHSITYDEIFIDGTLYAAVDYSQRFSGELTQEEAAQRYLDPLMLDPSLYGSITAADEDTTQVITLAQPTAAEAWAMPAGAEMTDASGEAVIGEDGTLQSLAYTITYQYGPAEITLDVDASIMFGPTTVNAPSEAANYVPLQDVDALYLSMNAACMLYQSQAISTSSLESVMSQAAGVVRNQSTAMDLYGRNEDINTKVDVSIYMMDYSTNQSQELDQEEMFVDGKYSIAANGEDPVEQAGVTADLIEAYCTQVMGSHIVNTDYWQDAVISDLGSTLLVELTFTEAFGDAMENGICSTFWYDGQFLRNLSSSYACNEATGYLAIDKFLGLPTAAGYYYEGTHTIEGMDYLLSLQSDQSIDGASMESYYNIREELPAEEEPDEKATPLFYHVTGNEGQEMWLFGTIHVGDERTAYLPQEIYDALEASDALALEYYSNGFDELVEEDDKLQEEVSNCYYYSDGTTTSDHVGEEVYEQAEKYLKATGNYNMNAPYMKASIWSNSIENFYLRQGYQLTSEQGCESRLEKLAEDQEKEIRDVESGLFQVKMLTGWSDDLQKVLLEDTLEYNAQEYWESTWELYELWCAGDEAALREELSDEVDTSELTEEELAEYEAQKHLIEEYNKAMSYDRNDGMLKVAIDYLESGDTVFYAVGLAHLLNDVNGLVDALRDAGYTVERVEYAQ